MVRIATAQKKASDEDRHAAAILKCKETQKSVMALEVDSFPQLQAELRAARSSQFILSIPRAGTWEPGGMTVKIGAQGVKNKRVNNKKLLPPHAHNEVPWEWRENDTRRLDWLVWDEEITVRHSVTISAPAAIPATSPYAIPNRSELVAGSEVNAGRTQVVFSAGHTQRLMRIARGAHVTLCGLDFHATDTRRGALYLPPSQAEHDGVGEERGEEKFERREWATMGDDVGGGAFLLEAGGRLSLVDSSVVGFSSEVGTSGGAIHVQQRGILTLTRSRLSDNHAAAALRLRDHASFHGGAIFLGGLGGAIFLEPSALASFSECVLQNNSARAGAGGAVCNAGGRVELRNSNLTQNQAQVGGALYHGVNGSGDISAPVVPLLAIEQSVFFGNSADMGGAALTVASVAMLEYLPFRRLIDPGADPAEAATYVHMLADAHSPINHHADPALHSRGWREDV